MACDARAKLVATIIPEDNLVGLDEIELAYGKLVASTQKSSHTA